MPHDAVKNFRKQVPMKRTGPPAELATIYVMAWGYLHLTGQIEEPFTAGLKRIASLAAILGVGLNLWLAMIQEDYDAYVAASAG